MAQDRNIDIARDRLTSTMFLAALAHGIFVMGISFAPDALEDGPATPTLEVALVADRQDEHEPEDAQYLAQHAQQGSGTVTERVRAVGQPLLPADVDSPELTEGVDPIRGDPGQVQQTSDLIVTRGRSARRVQAVPDASDRPQLEATLAAAPVLQLSILMVDSEPEAPRATGEQNRELLISVASRESLIAEYMHAWKRKVERIGTINFPDEARRRGLAGSPTLEVAIDADGMLREAHVRRSSGHPLLDRAALRILELASPFEPFPADLRERYDVLRFAYEWQFVGGELIDSAIRAGG